jgi:hypothetical protein
MLQALPWQFGLFSFSSTVGPAGVIEPRIYLLTPASSSANCTAGQMWADASFVYVCTAANTIKRSALSAF